MQRQVKELKDRLRTRIEELPDNPKIQRMSDTAFVMNIKDIGPEAILSPLYHDFKAQYRIISDLIDRAPVEEVSRILDRIFKDGTYVYKGQSTKFHPEVIRNLREGVRS